jgi:hypothetical protein
LHNVVIFGTDTVPANDGVNIVSEIHQEGGLPVPSRGGNKCKFPMEILVQGVNEAHPSQHVLAPLRRTHFREQDGHRLPEIVS